jgi:hypothetical protein
MMATPTPSPIAPADAAAAAAPARPQPQSASECYLLGLLDTENALEAALNALIARSANASGDETEFIRVSKGNVQVEYAKVDAAITAHLSGQMTFEPITDAQLQDIRGVLDRLQAFTAQRDKATAIVKAVTDLMKNWNEA